MSDRCGDETSPAGTLDAVVDVLAAVLNLGQRAERLGHASPLLGGLPEFDSMAVIALVTALEDAFDISFDDEDITAEAFETVGTLCRLVDAKRAGPMVRESL